jgi:hypothetical protein
VGNDRGFRIDFETMELGKWGFRASHTENFDNTQRNMTWNKRLHPFQTWTWTGLISEFLAQKIWGTVVRTSNTVGRSRMYRPPIRGEGGGTKTND